MTATAAFLLAFPALFSIVNPLGMAFIFGEAGSAPLPHPADAERSGAGGAFSPPV